VHRGHPEEGQTTLPVGKELPPLRVRFETDRPYYPLRYSSQQGDFTLRLYTLTDRAIDLEQSAPVLDAIGWINRPETQRQWRIWGEPRAVTLEQLAQFTSYPISTLPGDSLRPSRISVMLGELAEDQDTWHLGAFIARPNPADRPITDWTGDCFLTLEGQDVSPLATLASTPATPDQ